MENNYSYIDPQNQYADSSGVLYNLPNIKDHRILLAYESLKVSQRLEELFGKPIKIKGTSSLLEIHKHLFQDIYAWAGQLRTVNISKDGKPFFDDARHHQRRCSSAHPIDFRADFIQQITSQTLVKDLRQRPSSKTLVIDPRHRPSSKTLVKDPR